MTGTSTGQAATATGSGSSTATSGTTVKNVVTGGAATTGTAETVSTWPTATQVPTSTWPPPTAAALGAASTAAPVGGEGSSAGTQPCNAMSTYNTPSNCGRVPVASLKPTPAPTQPAGPVWVPI